jgi:hypothetical protein
VRESNNVHPIQASGAKHGGEDTKFAATSAVL